MVVAILQAVALTALSVPSVAVAQSNGYKWSSLLQLCPTAYFATLCALQSLLVGLSFVPYSLVWVFFVLAVAAVAAYFVRKTTTLKYTPRATRLLVATLAINWVVCWLSPCPFVITPIVVALAMAAAWPIERAICSYYLAKARKKLAQTTAVKVAVTGSFGKTSVKQILCQLLPNAIATPLSYNTPMGLAKFINQTDFCGADYVIFEMGARRRGDVAKLCRLVNPTVGVLTGITAQHLQSFKSIDNVIATKCELLNYLPKQGICVVSGFDALASRCMGVGVCAKKLCPSPWEDYQLHSTTPDKTIFSLQTDGKKHLFCSPLFGLAHFHNVALAISVALALGQDVDSLQARVACLQPVAHRLQVVKQGDVTIIDDAYNANLQGVKLACASLKGVDGFKVAISQGIVECGKDTNAINGKVGQMLGQVFDVVIACGPNAHAILAAVPDGKGQLAKNVDHAVQIAKAHFVKGAICLFQNDVPKLY